FAAVGFAVAAIHAHLLRKDPRNLVPRRAVAIALSVGGAAALLQPLSGDMSARQVARAQPAKPAAMASHLQTETGAPLRIGPLRIPYGLSLLAFHDPHALVKGLDAFPPAARPPVAVVHLAFQLMVACGLAMAATALLGGGLYVRRRALPDVPWYLRLVTLCGPLGFVAIEAGWTVTEVGRQPWIVHGIGPIWEANHVWLILVIVVLFVAFPLAFAAIGTALHIPLTLMLIGIVLRGSAFAFRSYGGEDDAMQRRWGRTFAMASVVTP